MYACDNTRNIPWKFRLSCIHNIDEQPKATVNLITEHTSYWMHSCIESSSSTLIRTDGITSSGITQLNCYHGNCLAVSKLHENRWFKRHIHITIRLAHNKTDANMCTYFLCADVNSLDGGKYDYSLNIYFSNTSQGSMKWQLKWSLHE